MKYLILMFGSQQDYDGMAGRPAPGAAAWTAQDMAAMGGFMESFGRDLAELIIPDRYRAAYRSALRQGRVAGERSLIGRSVELTALHHEGHEFPVEVTISETRTGVAQYQQPIPLGSPETRNPPRSSVVALVCAPGD